METLPKKIKGLEHKNANKIQGFSNPSFKIKKEPNLTKATTEKFTIISIKIYFQNRVLTVALAGDDGQPVSIQGFRISGWSRPQDKTLREQKRQEEDPEYTEFVQHNTGTKMIFAR